MATAIDYGQDLSCVSDLDRRMIVSSGRRLVAEAIARRLSTIRGTLINDSLYGYDLAGELNNDISPSDIGRISASVNAECLKDQRITKAESTVVFIPGQGGAIGELKITISLVTGLGPFTLVLSAKQVADAIQIVSIAA